MFKHAHGGRLYQVKDAWCFHHFRAEQHNKINSTICRFNAQSKQTQRTYVDISRYPELDTIIPTSIHNMIIIYQLHIIYIYVYLYIYHDIQSLHPTFMTGFGSTSHHIATAPARLFGPSGLGLKACILSLGVGGPEAMVNSMVRPNGRSNGCKSMPT